MLQNEQPQEKIIVYRDRATWSGVIIKYKII